jgi:hypothetical protein
MAAKQAFTRDQLVLVSSWLTDEPKWTLKEIRAKLVEEGEYSELSNVPECHNTVEANVTLDDPKHNRGFPSSMSRWDGDLSIKSSRPEPMGTPKNCTWGTYPLTTPSIIEDFPLAVEMG